MKTIYYDGDIITMTGAKDSCEALVTEDKKILYTGTLKQARALYGKEAQERDLKGHTLMPAFIDAHSHFVQTAQSIKMCDLSDTENFEDIVTALKNYLEKNQIDENGMIFATGYDHNFLAEQKHPDKTVLDKVSKTVPIYISHASGHMGAANSALLKLAGITTETKDPAGGRFGRDKSGEPDGYVEETPALMQVLAAAMPRMKMDMVKQMKAAQHLYLKYGITTVQEGAAMAQTMQGLTAFAASGGLELDVVAYILKEDYEKTVKEYADYNGKYKNRVKIGGVKVILDGSPQGKSAWLSKPYEGEENYCGYPTHDDAYVTKAATDAVRGGYQILAHCNGDAASEQFIQSYQAALKETGTADGDYRPVMIHCQTVRDDQLDRMAQLKMIPSIFIGHTYYWGDIHLKNLGVVRGARISPVQSALERGLIYNFHQDTPVTKPDMLHSVWCAVNRVTRKGQPIGQEQCINVYEALQAVTINAAYAYKEEDQKGTLEAGKMADMVILDANPLKADKKCIKDIVVLETIKEGKTVYKN
jgi:predicted amidohydrolase YtcJ